MKRILSIAVAVALGAGLALTQAPRSAEVQLKAAEHKQQVEGDLKGAIEQYRKLAQGRDRTVAAKALVRMGECYEKLGDAQAREARKAYERVVSEYADQPEPTKVARERLSAITAGGGGATGRSEVAMRRIWAAGRDWRPVNMSPDGRYVVFVGSGLGPSGTGDLWLRDLQSGEQRRITREGSWMDSTFAYRTAAISPDGKRIAYGWYVRGSEGLRLSALDGSSMRVLHSGQDGRSMNPSAWMPDGRRILAVSYDRKDHTYRRHIISLPDGAVRDIGQPEPGDVNWGYPSPDGRHIAYSVKGDIFVYDTATEQDSVLVQNPVDDYVTGWTPDGSSIVFVSNRSGTRDLYLLGIENGRPRGEPQLLRRDLGTNKNFYLTRDGRLFRIENTGTTDSFTVPVDEQSGKLTGSPSPVDPSYPGVWFPAWSPDGKLLYYTINFQVLVIRPEATGETRKITPKPNMKQWYRPILSPDGRRFAVSGTGENHNFGLFAIDSASGDVSQLAKIPTEIEPVDPLQNWSPDGKAIFYKLRSPEKREEFIIRRIDLTTGEEKEIHRGIHIRNMQISPDGTRFVYFWNDRPAKSYGLGILDIQSGKKLELWRVPEADAPTGIVAFAWTPDGRHVLVARNLTQGTELWRFPAAGGPGEKLHFFPDTTWGFAMHPSGKRMAFTQNRPNYELWVLENFLPAAPSR
jgi:Tol biopolymer transport system component